MIGNSNSALQIENLKSENIKKHVTILGVTGTYSSLPDAVDSGVFWTNPDDDGYYQDCEYVNYPYSKPFSLYQMGTSFLGSKVKRVKFKGCPLVTTMDYPYAYNNQYIEECDMKDSGITAISARAFQNCPRFKKAVLPASVVSIGYGPGGSSFANIAQGALIDCTELTYTGDTPNTVLVSSGEFTGNTNITLLFADEATMNVYAQSTNWSTYANFMTYVGAE